MRALLIIAFVLFCAKALAEGEFPIPSVDGKPAVASADHKAFKVPLRFAAVERFYREHFKNQRVTIVASHDDHGRVLKLSTKDVKSQWVRATVREGEVDTRIEVTQVIHADAEQVQGNGVPAVQFVIGRSADAEKMATDIDHLEH